MKESYKEDLANHFGLEPYAADGDIRGVASARGSVGQLTQRVPGSEIITLACRSCLDLEKATSSPPLMARWLTDAVESMNLCPGAPGWTFQAREPGDLVDSLAASSRTVSEPLRGND